MLLPKSDHTNVDGTKHQKRGKQSSGGANGFGKTRKTDNALVCFKNKKEQRISNDNQNEVCKQCSGEYYLKIEIEAQQVGDNDRQSAYECVEKKDHPFRCHLMAQQILSNLVHGIGFLFG